MKKLVLSLLLFFVFPILVMADVDYDITDYYIESHILENGDLKVQELFVLDGTFNGYERDIFYANSYTMYYGETINFENDAIYDATSISDLVIKAKYVNEVDFSTMNDNNFDEFLQSNYASNGDKAKFIYYELNGGGRYRMYYPSNNDRVAFYLTYTLEDVVVIHNDVAELYWNFIGTDYADELENVKIRVYLPNEDVTSNFRIWAHGNLTGEVAFLEKDNKKIGLEASVDYVNANEAVDIRTTFDKSLITDSTMLDNSKTDALEKIIEVETKRADEANQIRHEYRLKYLFTIGLGVIYLIAFIITVIKTIKKYMITKKSGFEHEYNREFIDDYNVEVIDYLLNKNNISSNAMSASIMNLIYKKNIKAEEIDTGKKSKNDYKFTLINEDNLNDTEKKLIYFLFKNIGKQDESGNYTFTTKKLRDYASSTMSYNRFISNYTDWKNSVIKDGKKEGFYENASKARITALIWVIIAFLLYSFSKIIIIGSPLILIVILSIIFLICTLVVNKKTEKGALHYDKWMAFKRFLKDFGTFNEKELPEIVLWERYLVYAVIFGIADKVQKDMNVKIKEIETTYGTTYPNIYVYHSICNSINYSVNDAVKSSYSKQVANSSSSSGSGSGGGFSSGGGFGGGGGGGRGF